MLSSNDVGQRIRWAREQLGLTQEQLGELVSLDQRSISELENSRRRLSVTELRLFAAALGKPQFYFLEGELGGDDWNSAILSELQRLDSTEARNAIFKIVQTFCEFAEAVEAKHQKS